MCRLNLSFSSRKEHLSIVSFLLGVLKLLPSAILATEAFTGSGSVHHQFLPNYQKQKNMATLVEEVCPSVEALTRREDAASFPCPTEGCSREFQNRPCLRMHLIKTHGIAPNGKEKKLFTRGQGKSQVEKHFYCPVQHCVRGQGTKRPFPRMSQLKQVCKTIDENQ